MKGRRGRQQELLWKTHGGRREGAGRKPRRENVGLQPHSARPAFEARVPVHVTMRAMRGVPSLRSEVIAAIVVGEIARASKDGFRVVHDSIQTDHLHLIAEADDGEKLSRGIQRLAARIARRVNAVAGRRGTFWRERYHRRDLGTPRQFRNALVYVTMNYRKHAPAHERAERMRALDGLSSAIWIDDWKSEAFVAYVREHRARAGPRPTVAARTWIARVGWKRLGRLDPRESPKSPG
jgi:putative transposase